MSSTSFSPLLFATSIASAISSKNDWAAEPAFRAPPDEPLRADAPAVLVRTDGLRLFVHSSFNGRVEVAHQRPRDSAGAWVACYDEKGNRVEGPKITVSADRAPALIAKDILRRLVPDAERVQALVLSRIEKADASALARADALVAAQLALPILHGTESFAHANGHEVEIVARCAPAHAVELASLIRAFHASKRA